jgi:phospholipid/cholesterol/gamma-HCH transport system substrate-binding protein
MELRHRREALVGGLIIAGAAIFLFLSLWLRGQTLRRLDQVKVVFDDVMGLKEGDPVRTSGVAVGQVRKIALVSPGNVDVWISLEHAPVPKTDAAAEIRSADLFGARYIEYNPGVAAERLQGDIRGTRMQDMSEMAARLGGQGRDLLTSADSVTYELRATLTEARRLLEVLNSGAAGSSHQLAASLEELRNVLHRVDLLVAENSGAVSETMRSVQSSAHAMDSLTIVLTQASARMDSILAKVNSGQGLAGALVNDTSLVSEMRATNTALRDLLVDFKANPSRYIRLRL